MVADNVTSFLNHYNAKDLAIAISHDHRTLTQCFIGVCIEYINLFASLTPDQVDGRNWHSRELARKITATKEWEDHSRLPYV